MSGEMIERFLNELPPHVTLVAAAKSRTPQEILEAIDAGITIIGQNYVQEAEEVHASVGDRARWHFIGHLQRNKVKKAVPIFDMIETIDSLRLAREVEKQCARIGRTMPVLVEVNSGREEQKAGVWPGDLPELVEGITQLPHLELSGLMTMGPRFGDPEKARPYFQETRRAFDKVAASGTAGAAWRFLSMGMSNTYRIAMEEGANIIRVGTLLFGARE